MHLKGVVYYTDNQIFNKKGENMDRRIRDQIPYIADLASKIDSLDENAIVDLLCEAEPNHLKGLDMDTLNHFINGCHEWPRIRRALIVVKTAASIIKGRKVKNE